MRRMIMKPQIMVNNRMVGMVGFQQVLERPRSLLR